MRHEFFIQCNPPKATSQQKGVMVINGHPRFFKKKHVRQAEESLTSLLMPCRPEKPFSGPLILSVVWCYPWRASESKRGRAQGWRACDTRPDCSNLIKMFEDCMTRLGFWTDDSQIFDLHFRKIWGDNPGIRVEIEGAEDNPKELK